MTRIVDSNSLGRQHVEKLVTDCSPSPPLLRRELHGTGITLKPLDARRDAVGLHSISHGSAEKESVWTYLGYGPFEKASVMQAFLETLERSEDPMFFSVIEASSGNPAGLVSFLSIDRADRRLELGHIWYGIAYQQSRMNTEAIYLMLREAFDRMRCRRVEWKCDAMNKPSWNAAVRLGFQPEGVFRQHRLVKGRNRDTAWFSILDSEWPRVREALEVWLAWGEGRPPALAQLRTELGKPDQPKSP